MHLILEDDVVVLLLKLSISKQEPPDIWAQDMLQAVLVMLSSPTV